MPAGITSDLPAWNSYSEEGWPTLLVGNGLSINLWDGYKYASLFDQSRLSAEAHSIFTELGTSNFETVLECLHHANIALTALKESADRVDITYEQVKDALFKAVVKSHVPWDRVSDERHDALAVGVGSYSSVYTTNYDLCLYWSQLETRTAVKIVDFFWHGDGIFDPGDVTIHNSLTTPIYYLHGALHLWQDDSTGDNGKWHSSSGNLLDWRGKYDPTAPRRPLFVSEGTSKAKRQTIRQSAYLSFCRDRLREDGGNTVIFGHSLAPQDQHIVDALNAGGKRKIAVSIYPTSDKKHVMAEKGRIVKALAEHDVVFFDSTTHPLGDPALHIPRLRFQRKSTPEDAGV